MDIAMGDARRDDVMDDSQMDGVMDFLGFLAK